MTRHFLAIAFVALSARQPAPTGRDGPVAIVPSVVTASAFTGPVGPNRLAQWAAMVNQAVVLRGDCFEIECRVVEATGFEACVSQAKAWCLFGRMDLRDVQDFQNGIR